MKEDWCLGEEETEEEGWRGQKMEEDWGWGEQETEGRLEDRKSTRLNSSH